MEVVGDLSALDRTAPIAFVATMGALHAGHSELIKRARACTSNVLVSVFVNPLQFDDKNDLSQYPRTPEADIKVAEAAGASTLWFPQKGQLYPNDFLKVPTPALGEVFEGVHRPGHFSGVLTAVSALFTAVRPRWAFFGEKDFQQLFLIRQMVSEQKLDIEIVGVPTIRDPDGLAISSRNMRLSAQDREVALVIPRSLSKAVRERNSILCQKVLKTELALENGFTLDYAAIIDEDTFALATEETRTCRALVAGWVNGVRLIDNMVLHLATQVAVTSEED